MNKNYKSKKDEQKLKNFFLKSRKRNIQPEASFTNYIRSNHFLLLVVEKGCVSYTF